ncbi:unnamed protein product [Ectocarpus sp. 12 AP-2014]
MTQHNMVAAAMPTEKEMRKARASSSRPSGNIRLHYTLLPLEVLVRTRGPQFHSHAAKTFLKVAGLVDCFLRHGRTLPDVSQGGASEKRRRSGQGAKGSCQPGGRGRG